MLTPGRGHTKTEEAHLYFRQTLLCFHLNHIITRVSIRLHYMEDRSPALPSTVLFRSFSSPLFYLPAVDGTEIVLVYTTIDPILSFRKCERFAFGRCAGTGGTEISGISADA